MFSEADVKDKGCTFPEALKTIEEKCHGQEACSMVTAPEIFGSGLPSYNGGDPCPGVSYFKVDFFQRRRHSLEFREKLLRKTNLIK